MPFRIDALTLAFCIGSFTLPATACGSGSGSGASQDASTGEDGSLDSPANDRSSADSDAGGPDADAGVTRGDADADVDGGAPSPCAAAGDRGSSPEEPMPPSLFIQNGGRVYDVQSPPTAAQQAAKGDGVTDDTAALQDAWDYIKDAYVAAGANNATSYDAANYWIYLPHGTYLVSDTVIYRGGTLETDPQNYVWNDVVNVRFVGESRATTTIRLADGASGFGDPANPKIVLALQHPQTVFNNIATDNVVRNLTIDVGHGNPGAVALFFQGANMTGMRDVTLRSGDGAGAYGLWFKAGSAQGAYRDVTIQGFDDGIYVSANAEMNPSLEHVTLAGQKQAGVLSVAGGLSLRALCSDQRTTSAVGVKVDQGGNQVVVLDSTLLGAGGSGAGSAMVMTAASGQSMFVRNVAVSGYAQAIARAGSPAVGGAMVAEWSALPTVTLFDGGTAHSLGLPVEDTPLAPWGDPAKDWADVDTFGAKGDGTTDDTAAIQAAMRSGKSVVVFPKAAYKTSASIQVPATVARVDALSADLHDTSFVVSESAATPLFLEHVPGYGQVTLQAKRDVVLSEHSGDFVDAQSAPVKVYLDNCDNVGANPRFCPSNQTTWARSIDTENPSGDDFLVAGGTLWVFDYKTENKPCISLHAADAGTVEVFNGYVNSTVSPGTTPMIVNDRSRMSLVGFTNLSGNQWQTSVQETRASGTRTISPSALPARDGSNVFIPLYSGDATQ